MMTMPEDDDMAAELARLRAILVDLERSRWMTRWKVHQTELAAVKLERDQLRDQRDEAVLHLALLLKDAPGVRSSAHYVVLAALLRERDELRTELRKTSADVATWQERWMLQEAAIKAKSLECRCACCVDQECHCGGICVHAGGILQVRRK